MRGRHPTPAQLKERLGETHLGRINYAEPVAAANIAQAPMWMTPPQRAEWDAVVASAPAGMLKELDRALLTAWVCAAVTYRDAEVALACERSLLSAKAARYMAIRNKQALLLKQLSGELGFSPAARPRIQVTPEPDAQGSEFEKLLG